MLMNFNTDLIPKCQGQGLRFLYMGCIDCDRFPASPGLTKRTILCRAGPRTPPEFAG